MNTLLVVIAGWVGLAALSMLVILPLLVGGARAVARWDVALVKTPPRFLRRS